MSIKKRGLNHYNIPVFIVLLVISIIMIYPFIWMVFSAMNLLGSRPEVSGSSRL